MRSLTLSVICLAAIVVGLVCSENMVSAEQEVVKTAPFDLAARLKEIKELILHPLLLLNQIQTRLHALLAIIDGYLPVPFFKHLGVKNEGENQPAGEKKINPLGAILGIGSY